MLLRVVLFYAGLFCAALLYAGLRCAALRCAVLCCAVLCCSVLCYVDSANYTQPLPVQKSSLSQGFCQGLVFLQVTGSIM